MTRVHRPSGSGPLYPQGPLSPRIGLGLGIAPLGIAKDQAANQSLIPNCKIIKLCAKLEALTLVIGSAILFRLSVIPPFLLKTLHPPLATWPRPTICTYVVSDVISGGEAIFVVAQYDVIVVVIGDVIDELRIHGVHGQQV